METVKVNEIAARCLASHRSMGSGTLVLETGRFQLDDEACPECGAKRFPVGQEPDMVREEQPRQDFKTLLFAARRPR